MELESLPAILQRVATQLGSLAKATPLDPQHRMYYITGTQRKGLVYMPYATCSHFRILSYQSAASTSFCVIFCGARAPLRKLKIPSFSLQLRPSVLNSLFRVAQA